MTSPTRKSTCPGQADGTFFEHCQAMKRKNDENQLLGNSRDGIPVSHDKL